MIKKLDFSKWRKHKKRKKGTETLDLYEKMKPHYTKFLEGKAEYEFFQRKIEKQNKGELK